MQRRQVKLLANAVHFLADDGHNFVERALPEKKIGVDPGGKLAYVTGADQKFVAGDFGVSRSFAESGDKKIRPAVHRISPGWKQGMGIVADHWRKSRAIMYKMNVFNVC